MLVPGNGEALLRTVMAGICTTDIELFKGYYRYRGVPGHEFVAVVEESPDSPQLVGKRVVSDINCACGACEQCRAGHPHHCLMRKAIGIHSWDGAFSEYIITPLQNLYLVDDEISSIEAVFVEPLAAALEVAQQIDITPEMDVLVLGDGKLGLLIAQALRVYNPNLMIMGKDPSKLDLAIGLGLKYVCLPNARVEGDLAGSFDLVIEATGAPNGINYALNMVRPKGTIALKTTSHDLSQVDISRMVVNEITLVGSRCGDTLMALDFLKRKLVDVHQLVERIYPFSEFETAFKHACQPGARKILIDFS